MTSPEPAYLPPDAPLSGRQRFAAYGVGVVAVLVLGLGGWFAVLGVASLVGREFSQCAGKHDGVGDLQRASESNLTFPGARLVDDDQSGCARDYIDERGANLQQLAEAESAPGDVYLYYANALESAGWTRESGVVLVTDADALKYRTTWRKDGPNGVRRFSLLSLVRPAMFAGAKESARWTRPTEPRSS